jgi:hypothetical protein
MNIKGVFFLNLFGIRGIVLYPFILFAPKNPDVELLQHELIHWGQIKSVGFFSFYGIYLKEYFAGRARGLSHNEAYREISFEQEAYAHQGKTHYIVTEESTKNFRSST